jgi:hypothetical protein
MMVAEAAATVALALTVHVGTPSLAAAPRPAEHLAPSGLIIQPAVLVRPTRVTW